MIERYYRGFQLRASLKTKNWRLVYEWEYFDPNGNQLGSGTFTGSQNQLVLAFQCWVNHRLWVIGCRKVSKVEIPDYLFPRKTET
ncbi:MAG TPA: hypothetical protein DCY91_00515 [Cyanobacteria bacterium UBA11370]|nr:hypothetical protein [Cyanobacteria bacterium UBA11370]HBY81571.1 hypothetical protein [Cyanobacteria bacterium UBA11148]